MESGRSGAHAERLAADRVEVWQGAELVVGDILTVPFLSFMELSTEFQLDVVVQAEEVQDPRERVRGCVYASQDKGSAIASSKSQAKPASYRNRQTYPICAITSSSGSRSPSEAFMFSLTIGVTVRRK